MNNTIEKFKREKKLLRITMNYNQLMTHKEQEINTVMIIIIIKQKDNYVRDQQHIPTGQLEQYSDRRPLNVLSSPIMIKWKVEAK